MTLIKDNPLINAASFPAHDQLFARPVWGPALVPKDLTSANEDSLAVTVARLAERGEFTRLKTEALALVAVPASTTQYNSAIDYLASAAATAIAAAQTALVQIQRLNQMPIGLRGLRVEGGTDGMYGGKVYDFTADTGSIINATFAPGLYGGLVYDLVRDTNV